MIDLLKISEDLIFKEDTHQYFTKDGQELISVSKLLSEYKNKFDPEGHIKRACAKRDGVTVNEIQEKWDRERDDACIRGQNLHEQLEYFVKTKKILDGNYKSVVEQFAKIKFCGQLYSEVQIFDSSFSIAGTTDLVEVLDNNIINLFDYKQNKKMDKKSRYNNKLLYPLDKYDECEFNIYCFQMNLYKFMLEQHGYRVKNMTLYYIPPSTGILEIFDVPHLNKDIKKLLKHHREMQEW